MAHIGYWIVLKGGPNLYNFHQVGLDHHKKIEVHKSDLTYNIHMPNYFPYHL